MSPLFPQLSFTSMVQMADRHVEQLAQNATLVCYHVVFEINGSDLRSRVLCEANPRELYLYRYRLDFDELGLHLQGLAQLCPDCLTLYYSQHQIKTVTRSAC